MLARALYGLHIHCRHPPDSRVPSWGSRWWSRSQGQAIFQSIQIQGLSTCLHFTSLLIPRTRSYCLISVVLANQLRSFFMVLRDQRPEVLIGSAGVLRLNTTPLGTSWRTSSVFGRNWGSINGMCSVVAGYALPFLPPRSIDS